MVAVELIESLYAIQTTKLEAGSVERVDDCCPQHLVPFDCIKKLGGICHAADYPKTTGDCNPTACKPFASFNKVTQLKSKNEDDMVTIIQESPLFVGIDASEASFQFYTSGIYEDSACNQTEIDHALQLVGYGKTVAGDLYWICKNSWGQTWGENGYIRILRGKNMCGIATLVLQVS
ncbi:unnamed protein product [Didymodactylos carnosus]|uniref:Peptidase C1A papain C-terminal domain-containing protein n=1 Tax=Didymodactylos carnosus TaxID=1234261 RepID=A0A815NIE0_9BILA|nr:unnamed protein product [Didymodactylos carnosus]CAF1434271.1 unnamed protein product [Didymodactylos carnosus]CAF4092023.1 unnamed protein product [Didymodactylos carnosus]CAF4312132.1 unnamed protein product [Didymodactylos carnosus]